MKIMVKMAAALIIMAQIGLYARLMAITDNYEELKKSVELVAKGLIEVKTEQIRRKR